MGTSDFSWDETLRLLVPMASGLNFLISIPVYIFILYIYIYMYVYIYIYIYIYILYILYNVMFRHICTHDI